MSRRSTAEAELEALLAAESPTAAEVERVLTHGHAEALELEAQRLRVARSLKRAETLNDANLDGVIATLREDLATVTAQLWSLQGRLSEAGRHLGSRPRFTDPVD